MDDQPIKFEIPLFGGTGAPAAGTPAAGTPAVGQPTGTTTAGSPFAGHPAATAPGHGQPAGAVHPTPAPAPDGAPSPAQPLTPAELQEVRALLSLLGPGWMHRLAASAAAAGTPAAGGPATPAGAGPAAAPDLGWLPEPGPSSEPAGPLPPLPFPGTAHPVATEPFPAAPPVAGHGGSPGRLPDFPSATGGAGAKGQLLGLWSRFPAKQPEREGGDALRRLLEELPDDDVFPRIFLAVAGVFPIQHALRHHTPDQTLAVVSALTDRALLHLAGIEFEGRRKLLRALARYASDVTTAHSFVCIEGDPFNNATCERVEGSNPAGRLVREQHGFVIVRKSSGEVFRLGRALT